MGISQFAKDYQEKMFPGHNGKKVMAVMTHEGSGLGSCELDLKKICSGASFGKGFAVAGHTAANSEAQVAAWAKSQV